MNKRSIYRIINKLRLFEKINPLVLLFSFLLLSEVTFSQEEKKTLRKGNDYYYNGQIVEAANSYKQSLKEKQDYYKANFNLGDALYKTAQAIKAGKIPVPDKNMTKDSAANIVFEQAANQFDVVAKSVSNADTIQKAWHNYGNAKLMQKSYEDAILGYKKALKLNPKDEETRYNLAYALEQLKKQNQNQKQNQQQNKSDDKKDNKKEKNQKDKENINNKNDKQKQEAQQPQMSKEQAEQMLNALKNSEKKLQSLRRKKGEQGEKIKPGKDW